MLLGPCPHAIEIAEANRSVLALVNLLNKVMITGVNQGIEG